MKRDSKFEILRIFSMFMIIIFHFEYFGQQWRINSSHSFVNYLLLASYLSIGKLGVYLFVMITGYFIGNRTILIQKSLIKSFNIWIQTFYYSVIIFVLLCLMHFTAFSFHGLVKVCFPFLTDQYWFVDGYIILLLLIPFINLTLARISKSQFLYLILIISFFASALAPIKSIIFSSELQFGYLIPPYLIGAFMKKYQRKVNYVKTKILSVYLLIIFCAAVCYQLGRTAYINIFYFGILQLLMAYLIFSWFANGRSFYNVTVNKFARTVFASYLITDNILIKNILWNLPLFHDKSYTLLQINLVGVVIVIGLLIICSIIDYVRIIIFNHIKMNSYAKTVIDNLGRSKHC